MGMAADRAEYLWALDRAIAEAPDDQFTLRDHLLYSHAGDPEQIPSTMDLQGLQQLHIKLHAQGADHSHYGISNGTGAQPFGAGVKSLTPGADSWRCKRCNRCLDPAEFVNMPIAGREGRLSCRGCLEDARIR